MTNGPLDLHGKFLTRFSAVVFLAGIAGLIYHPPPGVAMAVLALAALIMELDRPTTWKQVPVVFCAFAVLVSVEMLAIKAEHEEHRVEVRKLLDSFTGGDSFPVVEVRDINDGAARLQTALYGEVPLNVTQIYISDGKRDLKDIRPGIIRPKQDPVVHYQAYPHPFGYFPISDGYKLTFTIHAFNGTYREEILFSLSRRGKWSASWTATDVTGGKSKPRAPISGIYPPL